MASKKKPATARKAAKPVMEFWCCIHKSGEVWGDLEWTKARAGAMAADFNGRVVRVEVRR